MSAGQATAAVDEPLGAALRDAGGARGAVAARRAAARRVVSAGAEGWLRIATRAPRAFLGAVVEAAVVAHYYICCGLFYTENILVAHEHGKLDAS